ncbi:bzip family transcription factor [Trichoderma arundinaceum]|uniref:Bzip family transcription factor n=1 Tax=Trichoderma arundinaceum TaxID=490622 RepID=A0A395NZM6_TRIAR|nr:bzip family transcription factor [Trichoderma arundinaceum]
MSRLSRGEGRSPLPSLQSEISILNAEKYGEEPRHARELRSDDITGNGKRAASSDHDEDDAIQKKRSRGRPRLDTKDETAADRRRTQIRLAQRAYRHRKDTAITTLEQKVKDLEASNEAMSKEFTKFYDIILAEGIFDIAPHAAPRLRLIADRILRISSMVGASSITSSESDESFVSKPTGARKGAGDLGMHTGSQNSVVGEPELMTSAYSNAQHQQGPGAFSYEVIAQATPNNASFPFFASIEPTTSQQQSGSYLGNSIASPSPYPRLSPPASYAFHERTFSRRLQRTTLERGLKLATMKNPPPEQYATVFGFCLLFESREAIIRRLAAGLKKAQTESLDSWKSIPTDQFGFVENNFSSVSSDELNHALLSIGKSNSGFSGLSAFGSQPQLSSEERTEQRIRMICQNFEGEFFTAEEVELFLRRLGVNIPVNVDYVEAELDLNDLQAADEASTKSHFASIGLSPGNSGMSGIHSSMWHMNTSTIGDFASSLRGDSSEGQNNRIAEFGDESDPNGELVAFMNNHDFGSIWSTGSGWPKSKVSVDVSRLIDELVTRSVCLGRTPGVRPKDVIKSVKIAAGLSSSSAP